MLSIDFLEKLQGKHLFLQPHLDDVPFSIGSFLIEEFVDKESCTVFTIFGKEFFNIRHYEHNEESIEILKSEEAKWFKFTGIKNSRLELEEAGYRGITNIRKLFRAGISSDFNLNYEELGYGNWEEVVGSVKEVINKDNFDYIWIPSGVGGHCDHMAVRQAALSLIPKLKKLKGVIFYDELPYSMYSKPIDWEKCNISGFEKIGTLTHELKEDEQVKKYESLKFFYSQIDKRQALALSKHREKITLWIREEI